jgi:CRISPR-associated protein Cas8a1/Csx13
MMTGQPGGGSGDTNLYFSDDGDLRSHFQGKRAQYALVIPEVTDLELYAKRHWDLRGCGYKNFHASSLGDAALRLLTDETTLELARHHQVKRCQVITFGTVAWSSKQKTRTEIVMIEATQQMLFNYKVSCNCFSANTHLYN